MILTKQLILHLNKFDYGNFKTIWRVLIYQEKRSKSTKNTMDEIHAWHESYFIVNFYFRNPIYFI